ncbi:fasciclin domain-containing protein [Chitinophagaceae bacterium LWZ2-11]
MNIFSSLKWLAVCSLLAVACKKTEDPPQKIGQSLPYAGPTKTLEQLLDSLPDCTLYDAMYKRSSLKRYIDSINTRKASTPFTLFVPNDKALTAAGYSIASINATSPTLLDSVVRYLALTGNYQTNTSPSGVTITTLMVPDAKLVRTTVPTVFTTSQPYLYLITPDFKADALWLNGKKVSSTATPIAAVNGSLYRIDSLVQKPYYELYQAVNTDTSLTYYMAALRISDSLYKARGILGTPSSNTQYNDTLSMMLAPSAAGLYLSDVLLAPTNDAFRRAGYMSVSDIRTYINKSSIAVPGASGMYTNMDSVLNFHQLVYGAYVSSLFAAVAKGYAYTYTCDMLSNPYIAQAWFVTATTRTSINNVFFKDAGGGHIGVQRIDAPGGRQAVIMNNSDIITLNGVIHHVDNLLLPTP